MLDILKATKEEIFEELNNIADEIGENAIEYVMPNSSYSNSLFTIGDMLDHIDLREKTVIERLKNNAFAKIEECTKKINIALYENRLSDIPDLTKELKDCTAYLESQINTKKGV